MDLPSLPPPPPPPPITNNNNNKIPPPPPLQGRTVSTRRLIRPELNKVFKDHGAMERRVHSCIQHRMTEVERQAIPTDYPDTLTLSNLSHVLALIGQQARFSAGEIQNIQEKVNNGLVVIVKEFRELSDTVIPYRQCAIEGNPYDIEKVKEIVQKLQVIYEKVEEKAKEVKELVNDLRATRPLSAPLKEKTFYDFQGAIWIVEPIRFYKSFHLLNSKKEIQLQLQLQIPTQTETQTQTQIEKDSQPLTPTQTQSQTQIIQVGNETQTQRQTQTLTQIKNESQTQTENETKTQIEFETSKENSQIVVGTLQNNNQEKEKEDQELNLSPKYNLTPIQTNININKSNSKDCGSPKKRSKIQIPPYSKKKKRNQVHKEYKVNTIADFCQWCCERIYDHHIDHPTKKAISGLLYQTGAYDSHTGLINRNLLELKVREYFKYFKGTLPQDCLLSS